MVGDVTGLSSKTDLPPDLVELGQPLGVSDAATAQVRVHHVLHGAMPEHLAIVQGQIPGAVVQRDVYLSVAEHHDPLNDSPHGIGDLKPRLPALLALAGEEGHGPQPLYG